MKSKQRRRRCLLQNLLIVRAVIRLTFDSCLYYILNNNSINEIYEFKLYAMNKLSLYFKENCSYIMVDTVCRLNVIVNS